MGTLNKKWGPNGDPKSEKGPHGDPGPQMGTHVGAVHTFWDFGRTSSDWLFGPKKMSNYAGAANEFANNITGCTR